MPLEGFIALKDMQVRLQFYGSWDSIQEAIKYIITPLKTCGNLSTNFNVFPLNLLRKFLST